MTTFIDAHDHIVVVTGAGFSAPSGLPVYRDGETGWMDGEAERMSHASRYGNHLDQLWPIWHELAATAAGASPNAAHLALTRWQQLLGTRQGSLTVITQNIDGLHTRAGTENVLEVHGSIHRARKLNKVETFDYTPDTVDTRAPAAADGSRRTRPDIVLFGERPRHMSRAVTAIRHADLVIFAGTSGRVWPVAGLLDIAQETHARTMLLNLAPWDADADQFDLVINDDVLALDELVPPVH